MSQQGKTPSALATLKPSTQVLSVMEKGGGQLEVPLDNLAQHVVSFLLDSVAFRTTRNTRQAATGLRTAVQSPRCWQHREGWWRSLKAGQGREQSIGVTRE